MADSTGRRTAKTQHVLIVGGSPTPSSPDLVAGLAETCDFVFAVDRGADTCRLAGIIPDAFCGDEDTASPETIEWIHENVPRREKYDTEKDATDTAYALDMLEKIMFERQSVDWIPVFTCVSGGYPDHALGVYGQALRCESRRPMIVENGYQAFLLSPLGRPILELGEAARGTTFSLIPLTDCEVSIENMYWELDHEQVEMLSERCISNIVSTGFARVTVHEGCALAFQFWSRR